MNIVVIKSANGYYAVCNATNGDEVGRIRKHKRAGAGVVWSLFLNGTGVVDGRARFNADLSASCEGEL